MTIRACRTTIHGSSPDDTKSMLRIGRNMANRRHSAVVPSGHAAFKTGSQIRITDLVEGSDDLLLGGICHFHFALGGHASIYVARSSEPRFFGE